MYVIKGAPFEYSTKGLALREINKNRVEPLDFDDFTFEGDSMTVTIDGYSISIVPAGEPTLETLEALDMIVVLYMNAEHGDCLQTTYLYGRDHSLSEIVDLLENEFGSDIEVVSVVR
jgi:hypothetical protein